VYLFFFLSLRTHARAHTHTHARTHTHTQVRIQLVEAMENVLSMFDKRISEYTEQTFRCVLDVRLG